MAFHSGWHIYSPLCQRPIALRCHVPWLGDLSHRVCRLQVWLHAQCLWQHGRQATSRRIDESPRQVHRSLDIVWRTGEEEAGLVVQNTLLGELPDLDIAARVVRHVPDRRSLAAHELADQRRVNVHGGRREAELALVAQADALQHAPDGGHLLLGPRDLHGDGGPVVPVEALRLLLVVYVEALHPRLELHLLDRLPLVAEQLAQPG
mmetsp:Transcript_122088/g.331528  ORF Transcript_122088/g.331528 Transcript_122088/m.331528 type:complete len:206 (+) Transcript_122088:1189-1806(+)